MKWAFRCLLLLICFGSAFVPRDTVHAQDVEDFVVNDFAASYQITNEDKQGRLIVREIVKVTYSGQNHGLLRALPNSYDSQDLNLRVLVVTRDGKPEPYITYEEQDNTVLKIGDANIKITGEHSYTIEYEVSNVIRFYSDHDEFYWDINGDDWGQPMQNVLVQAETGARVVDGQVICFTGQRGSTQKECEVGSDLNEFDAETTQPLGAHQTLTVVTKFEKGYFVPPTYIERNKMYLQVAPVLLAELLILGKAYKRWERYGKDYQDRGVEVPYFERPKNVSVMLAAYVSENGLTQKHISAAIIDLAIRGYIVITETKERWSTKHTLTLKKSLDSHLTADERKLLEALIGASVGNSVKLEDKKNKLFKTFNELSTMLDAAAQGVYYELTPKKAAAKQGVFVVLSIVAIVIGAIFAEYTKGILIASGSAMLLMTLILMGLMTKRSHEGMLLREHMKGLKLYLSRAQKDRMAQLDAVAAPLSPHGGQPTYDVKFFEKLLPFAVAAGVEKTWAKAFESMYTQPPEWYSGNWKSFSAVALTNSIASTTTATTRSFSAPSSSGSSGFSSGGGFSGGGGGGGGGGGW